MVTGRKLLLADDSVTIQKVVDLTFTDEGLEVATVSDGQQALDKLEEFTPDIVLADVFMPKLNGYELCEQIKRDERFRHIPVLLLVGSFEPFDEAEARRVGADDYLTKPFQSIRTLIGKVRNLLSGGGGTEAEQAPTRQLAPPPEVEKVKHPDSDFLELTTADTAPLPDASQESGRAGVQHKIPFADLSMDDEMIEATPASNYGHTAELAQTRMTTQYSAADLQEAGIAQAIENAPAQQATQEEEHTAQEEESVSASVAAPTSESTHESTHESTQESTHESSHPAASQPQPAPPRASVLASSEDALLDLDDIEPPPALTEADDFFLDLLDDTPPSAQKTHASVSSETSTPSVETAKPAPQRAQEFVEAEIIEDSSAEFAPTEAEATPVVEQHTTPVEESRPTPEPQQQTQPEASASAQSAPTERLPEDYQMHEAPAASTPTATAHEATESAASPSGQITLDQLAPEVIDAIARRAVEQLSARTVEQIAWEVVPELAELLIKKQLEEKKQ